MKRAPNSKMGFSLVEVTIAIGILGVCFVSILGLLSVGMKSDEVSSEQTAAASLARMVYSDLANTPLESGSSMAFKIPFPEAGKTPAAPATFFYSENGEATAPGAPLVSGSMPARYRVSVWLTPPPAESKSATAGRILITWPAMADPNPNEVPRKFAGSCEIITAFQRQ